MSEERQGKFKKAKCPCCGEKINFDSVLEIDYDIRKANSRVWCNKCNRYIKFSLKNSDES